MTIKTWGTGSTRLMVSDGKIVPLRSGGLMLIMYGTLANQTKYSMQALRSDDNGHTWVWMSTVSYGEPSPCDNPSEHDCVYLRDGSIYCVWRSSGGPLCASQSRDDGKSWSSATPFDAASGEPFGVEPKMVLLEPSGILVISAGRPGVYLWASEDPL